MSMYTIIQYLQYINITMHLKEINNWSELQYMKLFNIFTYNKQKYLLIIDILFCKESHNHNVSWLDDIQIVSDELI